MGARRDAQSKWGVWEWCAYDTWTDKDGIAFEVCTFVSCSIPYGCKPQVLVTCFQHFLTTAPQWPHPMIALADAVMTHYRMFYRALARGELKDPAQWRHSDSSAPYVLPRDVVEHFGAPGATNPEDTGAYPPYRYDGDGFFCIDLLDPEDGHDF